MGNLSHNEESIASIIREGYISLFTTSNMSAPISIWNVTSWTNIPSKEEGERITCQVIEKEVKDGFWSMKLVRCHRQPKIKPMLLKIYVIVRERIIPTESI